MSVSQTTDITLISSVLDGNTQAFAQLVDRYKDMVYTIAVRIVKSPEDAEEVAQDSFLKAYEKLGEFRQESKFSTWLYSIVYHSAISKTRKKQLETAPIDDFVMDNVKAEDSVSQLGEMKAEAQQHYIKEAIASLKGDEATLLTLYYMEEQSVEEISTVTGLSNSNVKVKLHRARKRLHTELQTLLQGELESIL